MTGDELTEGLNDEQRLAVTSDAAPLCILAGAGSGKTRVLTRRIAYRAATATLDPRRVLVLTFTRAAARELVARLRSLGLRDEPTAGTFHAIAYAQLRRRWAEQRVTPPTLLDRKTRLLARLLPKGAGARTSDVALEIEWAKARVLGPDAYAAEADRARREPPLPLDVVAEVYRGYEAAKRAQSLVDFDDLLWLAAQLIERDPDAAAAQRWAFQHLFVDEFQDVNPLQLLVLQSWLGARSDLCVVGDPNQAIYGWNGADPRILTTFTERFLGAEVITLPRNHRSTPQVLTIANRVLDAGRLDGVRLTATRPDGPDPVVVAYDSAAAEADGIARAVQEMRDRNVVWSQQAVLVRTNAQTAAIAGALEALGIPARVRSQTSFLEQPAVKEAIAALRRDGFTEGLAVLDATLETAPTAELAELGELVRLAGEYTGIDPVPSANGFTGWLATILARDDTYHAGSAVEVVTFHAAKGLEWPVVHVAGLEAGFVPNARARTSDAIDEERRLFYVAVTRAERELRLSWAASRTFGTKEVRRQRSPFLAELDPVLLAMAEASAPVDGAAFLTAVRGPRRPTVTALFTELEEWRAARARAVGLSAQAVLDDESLGALAEARPVDERALQAVPGISPMLATRLAAEVLPIIARHPDVESASDG